MSKYLLVESRDPFDRRPANDLAALAAELATEPNQVTLFLIQNGVLEARDGAAAARLGALRELGVTVLADEFSLRERGIAPERLSPLVSSASLGVVVAHLARGDRTLWH